MCQKGGSPTIHANFQLVDSNSFLNIPHHQICACYDHFVPSTHASHIQWVPVGTPASLLNTTCADRFPASNLPTNKTPVVISGPSGVGKGTLIGLLFERHPDTFAFSVSHTTRNPRNGEQNGINYHFVTKEAFQELKQSDGFVESAQFGSNFYGTSKATIEEQTAKGRVVVLDIEMEGVKQIRASDLEARFVFIAPPSEEELERRLRGRGTDAEKDILTRLAQAKKELDYSKESGVHDKIIENKVCCISPWDVAMIANGMAGLGDGLQGVEGVYLCACFAIKKLNSAESKLFN